MATKRKSKSVNLHSVSIHQDAEAVGENQRLNAGGKAQSGWMRGGELIEETDGPMQGWLKQRSGRGLPAGDDMTARRRPRNRFKAMSRVCDILACDVLWTSSLVNAPMPLVEMAAREKEYSVFGFRPSTV